MVDFPTPQKDNKRFALVSWDYSSARMIERNVISKSGPGQCRLRLAHGGTSDVLIPGSGSGSGFSLEDDVVTGSNQ